VQKLPISVIPILPQTKGFHNDIHIHFLKMTDISKCTLTQIQKKQY